MNKFEQIWNELENDALFQSGVLLRLYSAEILPTIYVALRASGRQRCLAIALSKEIDISSWASLKDIHFEIVPNQPVSNQCLLLLILSNQQFESIFSTLCEDLVIAVANIIDEQLLVHALLTRFSEWKALFELANRGGLSNEQQKGLFGELYFLRQCIEYTKNPIKCIEIWVGPTAAARDFQWNNWAVEVKTTTAINPQQINISNERQLDVSLIPKLYLVHNTFEALNQRGETLNELVVSVYQLCVNQPIAIQRLDYLLFHAGYFKHHQELYDLIGYNLHKQRVFHVNGLFPKLTESNLPNGVSDVKYTIALSVCEPFAIEGSSLFYTLFN